MYRKIVIFNLLFLIIPGCIDENASLSSTQEINWLSYPTEASIQDAWLTWDQFYRDKTNPQVIPTLSSLKNLLKNKSKCFTKSVSDIESHMENSRLEKYKQATSAEEAYPPNDRPRGQKDVDSVLYHISTQKAVDPIIVLSVLDLFGKKHLIKLDGAHRIMAALIRKSKVRICYINAIE